MTLERCTKLVAAYLLLSVLLFSAPTQALSVAIVGDSHTGEVGPQLARLLAASGCDVQVVYHNGWSARSYVDRPPGFPRMRSPDLVVVLLGGNSRVFRQDRYALIIQRFLDRLRRSGARHVLWVAPFPADDPVTSARHLRVLKLQRRLLTPLSDVTWVNPAHAMRRYTTVDGVHYSFAAYRIFSLALYNYVQPLLSMLEEHN